MNNEGVIALQREIHAGIPLSNAMGFEITALDDTGITVSAPLSPNLNVHSTGFAGSLYALGILTGWGMVRHLIRGRKLDAELVVAEASIRYREPVRDDIQCRCDIPAAEAGAFIEQLGSKGRSKLVIEVLIGKANEANLSATMVARLAPSVPKTNQ